MTPAYCETLIPYSELADLTDQELFDQTFLPMLTSLKDTAGAPSSPDASVYIRIVMRELSDDELIRIGRGESIARPAA